MVEMTGRTKAEGYAANLRQQATIRDSRKWDSVLDDYINDEIDTDDLRSAADFIDEIADVLRDLLECAEGECVSGSASKPIEIARALLSAKDGNMKDAS